VAITWSVGHFDRRYDSVTNLFQTIRGGIAIQGVELRCVVCASAGLFRSLRGSDFGWLRNGPTLIATYDMLASETSGTKISESRSASTRFI